MIILGLNAFHADSSAALLRDGKLIAAAEEERFRRIKHWAGFPSQAIAYCLSEAAIRLSDVEHIAFNQDSRANLLRKVGYFVTKRPNIKLVLRRLRNRRSRAGIPALLEQTFSGETIRAAIHPVEHHLAHLSSAFHVCPFDESSRSFGRRLWGFLECSLGRRGGLRHLDPRPRIFSAFARHLLPSDYTIPRLSPLWRRIQSDGTCTLWAPFISRQHAENCAITPRRRVRA